MSGLAFLPILAFGVFIYPLFVEPLFFRFTPLADAQPQLASELERVVTRAGEQIPQSRMFEMNASSKLNALNAYVTGIGASRRVVVWDTTIARMTTPEIAFVFGHEMGHYVLGHVRDGMLFTAGVLLVFLFVGSRLLVWAIARWGGVLGMRGVDDWASLPVLLLLMSVFGFLSTPVSNAYSRHLEHQADQYGLEVVHGIVSRRAAGGGERLPDSRRRGSGGTRSFFTRQDLVLRSSAHRGAHPFRSQLRPVVARPSSRLREVNLVTPVMVN